MVFFVPLCAFRSHTCNSNPIIKCSIYIIHILLIVGRIQVCANMAYGPGSVSHQHRIRIHYMVGTHIRILISINVQAGYGSCSFRWIRILFKVKTGSGLLFSDHQHCLGAGAQLLTLMKCVYPEITQLWLKNPDHRPFNHFGIFFGIEEAGVRT